MREWPETIVSTFESAGVDYDDVADLDGEQLFAAYLKACGLEEWADHLLAVKEWCNSTPSPGDAMPEHLGQVADEFKRVSEIRLSRQKAVDVIKARETELREHLINHIDVDNAAGVMGLRYQATIKVDEKPRIDPAQWEAFYDWVAENDRFDLLQKRLSDRAIMELINDGEKIPGVEKMRVKSVSIKKI